MKHWRANAQQKPNAMSISSSEATVLAAASRIRRRTIVRKRSSSMSEFGVELRRPQSNSSAANAENPLPSNNSCTDSRVGQARFARATGLPMSGLSFMRLALTHVSSFGRPQGSVNARTRAVRILLSSLVHRQLFDDVDKEFFSSRCLTNLKGLLDYTQRDACIASSNNSKARLLRASVQYGLICSARR